jgi:serine/threonine protein kinase
VGVELQLHNVDGQNGLNLPPFEAASNLLLFVPFFARNPIMKAPEIVEICPTCGARVEGISEDPLSRVPCPRCRGEIIVSQKIDNYQLIDVLDQGHRGIVYRAHDATLGRDVALKVLRSKVQDTQLVGHLSSEAKAMGRLSHPHVVRVLSAGNDRGRYYTAMELSGHGSLRNLVDRKGSLPEVEVLNLGIQIAEGLQAAWRNGVVHGRVRPQNILFSDPVTAKIGNFGLTITSEEDAAFYDAPEILAKTTKDRMPGDIYSLGATLIFALTGQPPFAAQCSDLKSLPALKAQPVDLKAMGVNVSDRTSAVLLTMMQADPSQRLPDYENLIACFQAAKTELINPPLTAPPPSRAASILPSHAASRSGVRIVDRPAIQSVKSGAPVRAVPVPNAPSPAQKSSEKAAGPPKSGKARLWITIAASALVLGIGSTFLFHNPLPNPGKQNPNRKPRAAVIEEPEKDSTDIPGSYSPDFAEAYQHFSVSQFQAAADAFRSVHQNATADPMGIEWALLHEGMALIASGKLQDGQNVFRTLQGRLINPNQPREVQESLRKIAALAAEPEPPSPNLAPLFNKTNHEAIAFLAFGLKSWEMKKFPEALVFFRQFQLAKPSGRYAWIARLKPVASRLQDEYTASLMAKTVTAAPGPARPRKEIANSEKPKKVVSQKEILANTIPDNQRLKVAPGTYALVNFVSKKYLAIDPDDRLGTKLIESDSHAQPHQQWEIFAASPDKPGVYTLKSAASEKVINFRDIPWGVTRVLDIPPDRSDLASNWIFASSDSDGYYRLVSETALGSISTATDWEKGAGGNGIEIRIGHFSVSLWKLEPIEKK